MKSPIESAMALLDAEIQKLGSPPVSTSLWFVLRAKSTGLSLLRAMKRDGVDEDPAAAEAFRKNVRQALTTMGDA